MSLHRDCVLVYMNISITKPPDRDRYRDQILNGTGINPRDQKWLGPGPIMRTRNDRFRSWSWSQDVLCFSWGFSKAGRNKWIIRTIQNCTSLNWQHKFLFFVFFNFGLTYLILMFHGIHKNKENSKLFMILTQCKL